MNAVSRIAGLLCALAVASCTEDKKDVARTDTATAGSTVLTPPPIDTVSVAPAPAVSRTQPAPVVKRSARPPKSVGVLGRDSVIKFGDPKDPSLQMPPVTNPEKDSAFRPKATVDEYGNIQPIKRDTLR